MHSSPTARRRTTGVLLASSMVLAGCGLAQTEQTAETPASPPPPPPPPTSTAPPPPPPRPFELALDGVDPCSLLTDEQRGQLGFDREPLADSEGGFGNAATCSHRNSTAKVGARLSLITVEGMDVWTDDTAQVEATPVVIEGFPALVIRTPELNLSCNVAVDVAEGQHLDVLFRDDGANPPAPLDQLCAGAERVARDAVVTLRDPAPTSEPTSTEQETDPGSAPTSSTSAGTAG